MPSETTHWLIAQRAAAELSQDLAATPFGQALAGAENWLLLGAVFHDALFYIPADSVHLPFMATAAVLHAEAGQDSFTVIRSLIASLGNPARETRLDQPLTGLITGLASHIMTDAAFHPFVYFHTGLPDAGPQGLSHRSARAHYRLESLIDIHFAGGIKALRRYRLSRFLEPLKGSLAEPFQEVGRAFFQTEAQRAGFGAAMEAGFKRFARVQPIFQSRVMSTLLHSVRHALPRQVREYSALGYSPLLARSLPLLHGRIGYNHPVTGRQMSARIEELFEKAVNDTVELIRLAAGMIAAGEALPEDMIGPDLNGGLPGGRREDLKHRAEKRLIKI